MKIIVTLCCHLFIFLGSAQVIDQEYKQQIKEQINNLRSAHLNSDVILATKIYHPDLVLTSQSGKKYTKEVALLNIKNEFESYKSSDIEFLKLAESVVLTNYINERKYKGFDEGKYRLTVIWILHEEQWQIISMQSSKVKEKIKK